MERVFNSRSKTNFLKRIIIYAFGQVFFITTGIFLDVTQL